MRTEPRKRIQHRHKAEPPLQPRGQGRKSAYILDTRPSPPATSPQSRPCDLAHRAKQKVLPHAQSITKNKNLAQSEGKPFKINQKTRARSAGRKSVFTVYRPAPLWEKGFWSNRKRSSRNNSGGRGRALSRVRPSADSRFAF